MKLPKLIISAEFKMFSLQVKMTPKQFTAKITELNKTLITAFLQELREIFPRPGLSHLIVKTVKFR